MRQDAAKELLRRQSLRRDLLTWCEGALEPIGLKPATHHRLLIAVLQRLMDEPGARIMVEMPPGSAKSTYVSDLFVSWWFNVFPAATVIAASHTAELAEKFGRRVRNRIAEHCMTLGVGISSSNAAAGRWETTAGGEYYAAGVGGSITGRRADLLIIDDPVASRADADSKTMRDRAWDWYRSDAYTRLKPGARIVLVMTRWHEADLGGRLLDEMKDGGDQWEVIRLPALAEPGDPLGREIGEPLWPEWENLAALQMKRRTVGERDWASLYQQRPRPEEGSILKAHWWKPWERPIPEHPDYIIVSFDGAFTAKDDNCPSAATVWYVTTDPETMRSVMVLRTAWREWMEFPDLKEHVKDTLETFGMKDVPTVLLYENKATGAPVFQELRSRLPGVRFCAVNPRGDKTARAIAVTEMLAGGVVFALGDKGADDAWTWRKTAQLVIDECAAFPLGQYSDLTDTVTQSLRFVRDTGAEFFAEDEPSAVLRSERPALFVG